MQAGQIRPLALGIFRQGERILVAEGYDPLKRAYFYRPLGGGIEFGEFGQQALIREVQEELGAEITNLRYLGLSENIFTYNGEAGHELVLLFVADFVDPAFYAQEEVEAHEDDGAVFKAVWKPLTEFQQGTPLYPTGLLDLLMSTIW